VIFHCDALRLVEPRHGDAPNRVGAKLGATALGQRSKALAQIFQLMVHQQKNSCNGPHGHELNFYAPQPDGLQV
jgi:hypothetical protein